MYDIFVFLSCHFGVRTRLIRKWKQQLLLQLVVSMCLCRKYYTVRSSSRRHCRAALLYVYRIQCGKRAVIVGCIYNIILHRFNVIFVCFFFFIVTVSFLSVSFFFIFILYYCCTYTLYFIYLFKSSTYLYYIVTYQDVYHPSIYPYYR